MLFISFVATIVLIAVLLQSAHSLKIASCKLLHTTRLYHRYPYAAPYGTAEATQRTLDTYLSTDMPKKKLSLLGSTGSIGTQTLDIVRSKPELFECVAMAAGNNLDLLANQIKEFAPKVVSIRLSKDKDTLVSKLNALKVPSKDMPQILSGDEGIVEVARFADADTVVTGKYMRVYMGMYMLLPLCHHALYIPMLRHRGLCWSASHPGSHQGAQAHRTRQQGDPHCRGPRGAAALKAVWSHHDSC